MADNTKIEWTDATWNPITGCSLASPGCTNCYAMGLAGTRLKNHPSREGLTQDSKAGPVWTGEVRFNAEWLTQPLQWKRPRMIFVCAHGDLFHEAVPDEWIDKVFAVMALAPHHTFQVLTKRARRMREYLQSRNGMGNSNICKAINEIPYVMGNRKGALEMPLPNVWLGVSVEDQKRADERIPDLLATSAAVRWISAEPLLGEVILDEGWIDRNCCQGTSGIACPECPETTGKPYPFVIDWIVVGGESGPNARPMHPDWARSLRDQCAAAGVPFHFKQWGEWAVDKLRHGGDLGGDMRADRVRHVCRDRENDGHFRDGDRHMRRVGKKVAGRLLDGVEHNGWPKIGPTP